MPVLLLFFFLQSRAALSLLGYCYYHVQDFTNAADCYEQLIQLHPEVEDYKLYYAQSLYGVCAFQDAMKATFLLDSPTSQTKVIPFILMQEYHRSQNLGFVN